MLPQDNRLVKRSDFTRIHKKGRYISGGFLSVKVLKNDLKNSRFAFIVSTKVSKKAVDRNALKRQLREVVRAELPRIKPGFDVVFFTQKEALEKTFEQKTKTVRFLLNKAKLYT